jgi:hypothetical protein
MYPHPELIKGQGHTYAVKACRDHALLADRLPEQQICADSRKKKDPEIEMMNVRPSDIKKKVWYASGHNQENDNSCRHECEEKGHKNDPAQMGQGTGDVYSF